MTWHPDIPEEYRNQIVAGDAKELTKLIPDESIDLIFTDPVYDRLEDYEWLAKEATRILKPNRTCLVFHGIEWTFQTIGAMNKSLKYRWQFSTLLTGGASTRFHSHGFSKWYSCLWFEKGTTKLFNHFVDAQVSKYSALDKHHNWSKSPSVLGHWINSFTDLNDIIFDPFSGSGTVPAVCKMLGRNYTAFEIDPDTAKLARERVLNTQPPLFVLEPEQQEMEI